MEQGEVLSTNDYEVNEILLPVEEKLNISINCFALSLSLINKTDNDASAVTVEKVSTCEKITSS